jgi:ferredoxin
MILATIISIFVCFFGAALFYLAYYKQLDSSSSLYSKDEIDKGDDYFVLYPPKPTRRIRFIAPEAPQDDDKRISYSGLNDCSLFKKNIDSVFNETGYCCGLGTCVKSCKQEALSLQGYKIVIASTCYGCGECVSHCPYNLLQLYDVEEDNTQKNTPNKKNIFEIIKLWFNIDTDKKKDGN